MKCIANIVPTYLNDIHLSFVRSNILTLFISVLSQALNKYLQTFGLDKLNNLGHLHSILSSSKDS
jgi:hypothetical protein